MDEYKILCLWMKWIWHIFTAAAYRWLILSRSQFLWDIYYMVYILHVLIYYLRDLRPVENWPQTDQHHEMTTSYCIKTAQWNDLFFITRVVIALLFYGQSRHKSLIISYSCLKVSVSMPTTNSKKGKKKNIKNWKQSRWQSELLSCHLSNFLLWQRMVVEYAMWQRVAEVWQ